MEKVGGGSSVNPIEGSNIIGIVNAVSAVVAVSFVGFIGRRKVFIAGEFFMSLNLFLCGLSVFKQWNLAAFVFLNLFVSTYGFSLGSITWVYMPEVSVDAGTALAAAGMSISALLVQLTFDIMISSSLEVHGTIWYYSAMNFIGFIFFIIFVKESRGLTDLEKKSLYSPKNIEIEELIKSVEMTDRKVAPVKK